MTAKEKEKGGSSKEIRRFRYHVIDMMLSLFVFFVGMLCYWRGIWDLYTYYFSLISTDEGVYNWYIFATGSGFIFSYLVYPLVNRLISGLPVLIMGFLVRLMLYLGGVFAMGYWRGVWGLLDHYLQMTWQSGVAGLAISFPILLFLNASRTVIFPPFVVSMDSRADALIPGTRFQTKLRLSLRSIALYVLDSIFTHFFILTITIVAWRSMLTLIGLIPFPTGLHDFICFGIGIFTVIILFTLEIPFAILGRKLVAGVDWQSEAGFEAVSSRSVSEFDPSSDASSQSPISTHLNFFTKIQRFFQSITPVQMTRIKLHVYEDLVFLVAFTSEAFLWLGGWNLNATYIVADKQMGGWINHVLGSFILICMGVMSFGGYCGCGRDDSLLAHLLEFCPEDTLYLYPVRYIRSLVAEAREESESSSGPDTSSSSESPISVVARSSTDHTNLTTSTSSIVQPPYETAHV